MDALPLSNRAGLTGGAAAADPLPPAIGAWSGVGSMGAPRHNHTATLLPNGKVLVAGGYNTISGLLASAELYDPATGRWSATGSLNTARQWQTATLLANGKVLVAGGLGSGGMAM